MPKRNTDGMLNANSKITRLNFRSELEIVESKASSRINGVANPPHATKQHNNTTEIEPLWTSEPDELTYATDKTKLSTVKVSAIP